MLMFLLNVSAYVSTFFFWEFVDIVTSAYSAKSNTLLNYNRMTLKGLQCLLVLNFHIDVVGQK